MYGCEPERSADDVFADEGTNAVVYGHEAVARDFFETAFDGLEAGVAARLDDDGCCEVMFCRELFPDLHVVFGQHKNDLDLIGIPYKSIDCMNQYWSAVELQELFGYGAFDARSFSAGNDQCILWCVQALDVIRIKVVKRL